MAEKHRFFIVHGWRWHFVLDRDDHNEKGFAILEMCETQREARRRADQIRQYGIVDGDLPIGRIQWNENNDGVVLLDVIVRADRY